MKQIVFCIIISILLTVSIKANNNPCIFNSDNNALPSNWTYSSLDNVKRCFQAIPVNHTIMTQTIQQLFNSMDFYSFLSIVRQSNSPYFMNVDLRNELINIKNQSKINFYQNDYDFHMSIVSSFKKLNDFHTQYNAPNGYANFVLLLPFILEFSSLTQQIKIKKGIQLYSSIIGNNSNMNYNDKIVTKIDNIPAFDYLKQFSDQHSLISKDKNVKLNSVFREEFWLRNLASYPLPSKNEITFTILDNNEITLTFPYIVIITKKFDNQISLMNENMFSSPTIFDQSMILHYVTNSEHLNWYHEKQSDAFDYIMGDTTAYYYIHKKTKTTIIKLESFDEQQFESIKNVFLNASGDTLIIDLIGNQGGHSCIAYSLLHYLVPEYLNLTVLYEAFDGRITKSLQSFSTAFSFYPNSILNLQTGQPFTNLDWIQPYVNYTRGNSTDEYSMKSGINCDGQIYGSGKFWLRNSTSRKYFKSIYALTDGTCGSACSLFLSKLTFASNFKKAYGLGGGYDGNSLFESSSYAGGGAFDWNFIVRFYNLVVSDNDSSISYLPTSAFFNLNVYELYIDKLNADYPREFVSQLIDKRVSSSDYFNLESALEEIINDDNRPNGYNPIINNSLKITILSLLIVTLVVNPI
ncbi:unnamed protein product [Rotaria sp. Silwood2]|nr:unnamed protein product [Rotaria sp. Silwood2]CAF4259401.1 unnamed protein product [Rotaria sp. Silwood2]